MIQNSPVSKSQGLGNIPLDFIKCTGKSRMYARGRLILLTSVLSIIRYKRNKCLCDSLMQFVCPVVVESSLVFRYWDVGKFLISCGMEIPDMQTLSDYITTESFVSVICKYIHCHDLPAVYLNLLVTAVMPVSVRQFLITSRIKDHQFDHFIIFDGINLIIVSTLKKL